MGAKENLAEYLKEQADKTPVLTELDERKLELCKRLEDLRHQSGLVNCKETVEPMHVTWERLQTELRELNEKCPTGN